MRVVMLLVSSSNRRQFKFRLYIYLHCRYNKSYWNKIGKNYWFFGQLAKRTIFFREVNFTKISRNLFHEKSKQLGFGNYK